MESFLKTRPSLRSSCAPNLHRLQPRLALLEIFVFFTFVWFARQEWQTRGFLNGEVVVVVFSRHGLECVAQINPLKRSSVANEHEPFTFFSLDIRWIEKCFLQWHATLLTVDWQTHCCYADHCRVVTVDDVRALRHPPYDASKLIRRRFSAGGIGIKPEVDRPTTTARAKPLLSAQHKAACMLHFRMALLLS